MKEKRWYPVPPYKNEGWRILNENGELVATFEEKTDCILTCDLYNREFSYESQIKNYETH